MVRPPEVQRWLPGRSTDQRWCNIRMKIPVSDTSRPSSGRWVRVISMMSWAASRASPGRRKCRKTRSRVFATRAAGNPAWGAGGSSRFNETFRSPSMRRRGRAASDSYSFRWASSKTGASDSHFLSDTRESQPTSSAKSACGASSPSTVWGIWCPTKVPAQSGWDSGKTPWASISTSTAASTASTSERRASQAPARNTSCPARTTGLRASAKRLRRTESCDSSGRAGDGASRGSRAEPGTDAVPRSVGTSSSTGPGRPSVAWKNASRRSARAVSTDTVCCDLATESKSLPWEQLQTSSRRPVEIGLRSQQQTTGTRSK